MPNPEPAVRPLGAADLEALVAVDAAIGGQPRRAYAERRLADARRAPDLHVQLAIDEGGALAGYALARVLEGEFGRSDPAMRLELIGVAPASQHRGIGTALQNALEAQARRRGIRELRTSASWRDTAMLRFLSALGWRHSRDHVLDCALAQATAREDEPPARDLHEVRALTAGDFEGVARIDRRLTGRDRSTYLRRALEEALGAPGVRASLAATIDGALAGFVMARADLGDFGRTESVAVLDTLGVDPLRKGEGVGRALLSQLFANLGALRAERVETMVAPGAAGLLAFFARAGFGPSERLAFVKALA
jgi:GNAT superfamily N-acetyltransferase